jgi:hypothetical protein
MGVVATVLSLTGLAAFLGGFPMLIWFVWLSGPDWAGAWGLFGIPVAFASIRLSEAISPSEPRP